MAAATPGAPPASRLERYLAGLPDGLASYPQCQAKGSVFQSLLAGTVVEGASLAEPLRRYLEDRPIASEWLPDVHLRALTFAIADQRRMTREALLAWVQQRYRRLFEGPLYRAMMALVPPATLVRTCAVRWGVFHRGTAMEPGAVADDGARVKVAFPRGLCDPQVLELVEGALRAALEASRAREIEVELEESTPTTARFRVRWL
jgi:hypothetical protein